MASAESANALVECVVNVSEGRTRTIVDSIAESVARLRDVWVLDVHADPDHHRSVYTFAGRPERMVEAALSLCRTALAHIDIRDHKGVHPRVGAVDVIPFVPLTGATMDDCVGLAEETARQIADRLEVPTYLYEQAARVPERSNLAVIRKLLAHTDWTLPGGEEVAPDFGQLPPRPEAGVTLVGARPILIAFNVVLDTGEIEHGRHIARLIRESGGGLPGVRALAFKLESRSLVQISMNLVDYRKTSVFEAFSAVRQKAGELGVKVRASELVGLAPRDSLTDAEAAEAMIPGFGPHKILEEQMTAAVF